MEDLIKALQILSKYDNSEYPTNCDHDVMYFNTVDPADVTTEDINALDDLGVIADLEEGWFYSFKFGSN